MIKAKLESVSVGYAEKNVLEDLNLEIQEGELLSLLGPSGCGKSTTLRSIAGFLPIRKGRFLLEDKDYTNIPIHRRDFGIVFQNYALFPHLNVFDNVAFGLRQRKVEKKALAERVRRMLAICQLEDFETRPVQALSGGQKQRVALARALVIEPKLLLLDEPLSNLDQQLRISMRNEIRRIQKKLNMTAIFVTHDQEECFAISDRVAIMKNGKIEQLGSPEEMYSLPVSEYVARFVGFKNFFPAERFSREGKWIAIRPKDVSIDPSAPHEGRVVASEYLGDRYQLTIASALGEILAQTSVRPEDGSVIHFDLPAEKCRVLER